MANRGRGYSQSHDWDPMREDYDNSNYDPQYQDDEASEMVTLNHSKLYVSSIPKGLNDAGLKAAFAKHGTLVECFISRDPMKRYAIITFDSPTEARNAMMKMNKTDPLKLNVAIAHEKRKSSSNHRLLNARDSDTRQPRERDSNSIVRSHRDDVSTCSRTRTTKRQQQEDLANGDKMHTDLDVEISSDLGLETGDPDFQLQLKHVTEMKAALAKMEKQIMDKAQRSSHNVSGLRCVMPDGKRLVVRTTADSSEPRDDCFAAGAGDSNDRDPCSCKPQKPWDQAENNSTGGCSTPSTCKLCFDDQTYDKGEEKLDYARYSKKDRVSKTFEITSRKSGNSKATDLTSKKSDYSKCTDTISKKSENISKKSELVRKMLGKKSEITCDLKHSDFCSDKEEESDETNRLIQLRNTDYYNIVEDNLKIVVALAGYPKCKMLLRQMDKFQKCLTEVIDMQLKAGLLKKPPTFLDYYLNRGAIVCICKDLDTRDWMVRVSPGMQERMCINLILLKANVKRLCLAVLKIPFSCWPSTAQDVFKLLQYFNPTLRTDLWKIYSQKTIDDVQCTSFLIDRVSGEVIRGPTFKNVIDYEQMEFELNGYSEIYYECLLSDSEDDLSSVASRVKLLGELKSNDITPRNVSQSIVKNDIHNLEDEEKTLTLDINRGKKRKVEDQHDHVSAYEKSELESTLQRDVLKKLKDVRYISDNDEVIIWSDETTYSDQENEKSPEQQKLEEEIAEDRKNVVSCSGVAVSENTESVIESNDNLTIGRNSNLNIDSNRGIAYHRRTNYLHVENELKIAITLEGYPQNKLEGTHIRRLKHLFKEYLHKDMKNQRFTNLIIPKFQDIYLSNGAVIYICDSMETKDYLAEVLPKFINSTGLKLTFRDIKNLVRYTRIVMRLPKEHAHVESVEILLKLQSKYPGLKPDCWKYYSDVAGKQKRQFGVDPESLDVIKSPDFDPTYEGDKIKFRVIDRQKRDISFEEPTIPDVEADAVENAEVKRLRETVLRTMHVPIDPEIMNTPLTRIRTNHYSDLIADDLKLYVGPSNYPESRIDDAQFHAIKRTFENIVFDSFEKGDMTEELIPKFHDMYLFDGVIFIICQNMVSRRWIEDSLQLVNLKLHVSLKATEFRGAVGIISMVVKTDKDTDEVISILQKQNPRLRTKYWRKISTIRTKTKLDVVLQIDKLSAQVMTSVNFNKFIGPNAVQFKLGHLQSLLKPKASLEELYQMHAKKITKRTSEVKLPEKSRSKVSMQGPKDKSFEQLKEELKKEYPALKIEHWHVIAQHDKTNHKVCDLEIDEESAKIIEKEDFKLSMGDAKLFFYTGMVSKDPDFTDNASSRNDPPLSLSDQNEKTKKIILKIPPNILPDHMDDLNIIFDLLEDKNPGLNTELWQVFTETPYPNNGKFTILIDPQSASVIQGKNFDSTIGGEKLKFFF